MNTVHLECHIVAQDNDRFKHLSPCNRPTMPDSCRENNAICTTRELIRNRLQSQSATIAGGK